MTEIIETLNEWGEDVNILLVKEKNVGGELVKDLELRVVSRYIKQIRSIFQNEKQILTVLNKFENSIDSYDEIYDYLKERLCNDDTEYLFSIAVNKMLCEHEKLKKEEPSIYLVNSKTGSLIKAIKPDDIFQPPDVIGDDGIARTPMPKVHPRITSALMMAQADENQNNKITKLKEDPKYAIALSHVGNTTGIKERVVSLLEKRGFSYEKNDGERIMIEFGQEHINGELESLNPSFHRINNHSSSLAIKIMKLMMPGSLFFIENIELRKKSKIKFYLATVMIKNPFLLT